MPQISAPVDDSDEEAAPVAGPSRIRAITRRPPIQPAVQKKVVLLASAAHVNSLSELLLAPSAPSSGLNDFCRFALALLGAFKGSPKWESILEAVLLGSRGKGLEKRIWREGVRGKWADSGDRSGWDHFSESESSGSLTIVADDRSFHAVLAILNPALQPLPAYHTGRRVLRHQDQQSILARRGDGACRDLARSSVSCVSKWSRPSRQEACQGFRDRRRALHVDASCHACRRAKVSHAG